MAMILIVDCLNVEKNVKAKGSWGNTADERSPKITLVASGSQFSRDIMWQLISLTTRLNCAQGRGLRLHMRRARVYSVEKRSREIYVAAQGQTHIVLIKAVLPD
jgi:hypothetical protein